MDDNAADLKSSTRPPFADILYRILGMLAPRSQNEAILVSNRDMQHEDDAAWIRRLQL